MDPETELVEKYVFARDRIEFADTYVGEEVFAIDSIGLELAAKDLFTRESEEA